MTFFIQTLFDDPVFGVTYLAIIIFSICLHEYGHARCALWQGDDTAAVEGHLTLNPLKQMGVMSLVMLAIIGFAWGQVPVNPNKFKHRYSSALVAFAGPFMNLCLVIAGLILYAISCKFQLQETQITVGIFLLISLNAVLFIINMIPCYPLDGWKIALTIAPKKLHSISPEVLSGISIAVLIIMFSFVSYIWKYAILFTTDAFIMIEKWVA